MQREGFPERIAATPHTRIAAPSDLCSPAGEVISSRKGPQGGYLVPCCVQPREAMQAWYSCWFMSRVLRPSGASPTVQLCESLSKSLCVAASFTQPCWEFDAVFDVQAHRRHAAALIDMNRNAKISMPLELDNTSTPNAGSQHKRSGLFLDRPRPRTPRPDSRRI
jgi:hypothetical protein